ncbi:glutathione S-transferase C-terminal domain-containing protein [Streptomyces sp. NPDC046324]|uniref:glutathione S-transferase C-terminal domain-containing protein n=1 Tax=Streptomyces sp. NPDC046324 TaxID=3154915 RepID=UPI0033CB3108
MSVIQHHGPYVPPYLAPFVPPATARPAFSGRIGPDVRSGHYPVPHRYRLHVTRACPGCLGIAVTHGLLGLQETVPLSFLPASPDTPDGGYAVLRALYEASAHQYAGPAAAPVLSDGWTGRIVSTHAPDILRDLALRFRGPDRPDLLPEGCDAEVEAIGDLCARGIDGAARDAGQPGLDTEAARQGPLVVLFAALGELERTLERRPYVLGDAVTAADVHVWVTLLQLDTVHRGHLDGATRDRIAGHRALWSYAQRLAAHPAFASHLDFGSGVGDAQAASGSQSFLTSKR